MQWIFTTSSWLANGSQFVAVEMPRELVSRLIHRVALEVERDVERAVVHRIVVERVVRLHVLGYFLGCP